MLRAWRNVQAFVSISIIILIVDVIWIDIIHHRMNSIDIDATSGINDFDEAVKAHPRVIINRNAEILLDRLNAQTCRVGKWRWSFLNLGTAQGESRVELIRSRT